MNQINRLELVNGKMHKGTFLMKKNGKETMIKTWIGVNGNKFYTTHKVTGQQISTIANTYELKKHYRIFDGSEVEEIENFFFGVN